MTVGEFELATVFVIFLFLLAIQFYNYLFPHE